MLSHYQRIGTQKTEKFWRRTFLLKVSCFKKWEKRIPWFDCGKMRTRKTPNTDSFYTLLVFWFIEAFLIFKSNWQQLLVLYTTEAIKSNQQEQVFICFKTHSVHTIQDPPTLKSFEKSIKFPFLDSAMLFWI